MEPVKTGFVELDVPIFYQMYGWGERWLVLLHGNGEDGAVFAESIPYLAAEYRLLVVDARGHGRSGYRAGSLTVDQLALDLAAVLDSLEIEHAHILGFSDGANVALTMALSRPELIDRLILIGGNLFPQGLKNPWRTLIRLQYGVFAVLGAFGERFARRRELLAMMARQPQLSPEQLAAISCPALVLAGDHDMIAARHTMLIADALPNSRLAVLKSCSHFVLRDQPMAAEELILDFLSVCADSSCEQCTEERSTEERCIEEQCIEEQCTEDRSGDDCGGEGTTA